MHYISENLLTDTNNSDKITVQEGDSRTVFKESPTSFGLARSLSRALSCVFYDLRIHVASLLKTIGVSPKSGVFYFVLFFTFFDLHHVMILGK